MATRANYDSSGIHTGLAVGQIYSDLEIQFIANRKEVLDNAAGSTNFQLAVYQQMRKYQEVNRRSAESALNSALEMATKEIAQSYNVGINTVDRTIEHYRTQGYKPNREPQEPRNISLAAGISIVTAALGLVASESQSSADRQLLQIVNLVNPSSADLRQEIDRVQISLLTSGISGSDNFYGVAREMSSQSEMIIRDISHQTLLGAEGERQQDYGNNLIQISAHPSSCPLCVPWQGRVLINDLYSDGRADGKHELLSIAVASGLFHINCRHNYVFYVPGLSKPDLFNYDKASRQETATRYAIEQEQRNNERHIRAWKRREAGAMTGNERQNAQRRIRDWQYRQRALAGIAEEEGVPFYRQYSREQIGGQTKPSAALAQFN